MTGPYARSWVLARFQAAQKTLEVVVDRPLVGCWFGRDIVAGAMGSSVRGRARGFTGRLDEGRIEGGTVVP